MTASGPPGWAPVERLVVHHQDGDASVTVETWPVGQDADLTALATAHAERSRGGSDWVDTDWEDAQVLGVPGGRQRSGRGLDAAGRPVETVQGYALQHGRLTACTSVVPAGDRPKAAAAAEISSSVVVRGVGDVDRSQPSLRPSAHSDFSEVRAAWVTGRPRTPGAVHVLTTEECFAAAAHHGVTMLPGVDPAEWHALTEVERDVARGVAWRSLVARGAGAGELGEVLELAASHDVLMVVTARGPRGARTTWYAARPDRAVRTRAGQEPGQVEMEVIDTGAIADAVIAEAQPDEELTTSVVHRHDGRVVGRETSWPATTPADEARHRLADLLPGRAVPAAV